MYRGSQFVQNNSYYDNQQQEYNMYAHFNISEQERQDVSKCLSCTSILSRYKEDKQQSIIDPLNQLFYVKDTGYNRSRNAYVDCYRYFKARLIKVLDFKSSQNFSFLNLQVLDENSNLRVLNFKVDHQIQEDQSLDIISKMLLPYELYTFFVGIIVEEQMMSFKKYTDEKTIQARPIIIHMHGEEQNFPKWANIQMNDIWDLKTDQSNNQIHKTYNLFGVLKHFALQKLTNYQQPDQNGEAILTLVDQYFKDFKAKIWGSYEQLQKLRIKDLIFLKQFKFELNAVDGIQVRSIGTSQYEQNPYYINPNYRLSSQKIINQIFFENIEQFTETQQDQKLISGCYINTAFLDNPVSVVFKDMNNQLIKTYVVDENLSNKLKSVNLQEYSDVIFDIIIKPQLQISQNGDPSIQFILIALN